MYAPDGRTLSARQIKIYQAIQRHIAEHGYQPSIRELCATVGLRSPSSVHHHLKAMEATGLVQLSGHPRAIVLTAVPQA